MEQTLERTTALLTRTPAVLDVLLRDLQDVWALSNEGGGTWSPYVVMAHLIHGEHEDWLPRTRVIMESGETRAFVPFERDAHVRYAQGKTLEQLLDEFALLRRDNLDELRELNLTTEDMKRRGRHPVFGSVTLSELLATWAAHDLTHLHQISRIMAHQYREAVGQWARFLGVMQCGGHSEAA
jgi:hypothetical protein